MYDRKVTLPLTEAEWRALCETAKSADRTPKLQARHLVRAALGMTDQKTHNDAGRTLASEPGAVAAIPG
jgi:hypothetical protein